MYVETGNVQAGRFENFWLDVTADEEDEEELQADASRASAAATITVKVALWEFRLTRLSPSGVAMMPSQ
jgi:hypothetical protein